MAAPALKSENSDTEAVKRSRQGGKRNSAFAERLEFVLQGRNRAEIARKIGSSKTSIGDWAAGRMPAGDMLVRLADELGCDPRWLATGQGSPRPAARDSDSIVELPCYDLDKFSEMGRPEPSGRFPVSRDMLGRWERLIDVLWVAELPASVSSDFGREGQIAICKDAETPLIDGRPYIFLFKGAPIVRRIGIRSEGTVLLNGRADPSPIRVADIAEGDILPVARIIAVLDAQEL